MRTKRFNDARFYTSEQLSPRMSKTPEGFLLCEEVPIARIGKLVYSPDEIDGIEPGDDGLIHVYRDEETLFSPETLASFEGKSITIGHPPEFVDPENFKQYDKGTVFNVRRGTGDKSEMMVADLLVKAADAIQKVLAGLREISNGYDADYEQVSKGLARQKNIKGNHVAFVEAGRCGSSCKIGDQKMSRKSFIDRICDALKMRDEEAVKEEVEKIVNDEEGSENEMSSRLAALETSVAEMKDSIAQLTTTKDNEPTDPTDDEEPELEKEGGERTDDEDSEEEKNEVRDTMARVAMLCPGYKVNGGLKSKKALDSIKRKALMTADSKFTKPFGSTRTMDSKALHAAFIGASELARRENNSKGAPSFKTRDSIPTNIIADINRRNREVWSKR